MYTEKHTYIQRKTHKNPCADVSITATGAHSSGALPKAVSIARISASNFLASIAVNTYTFCQPTPGLNICKMYNNFYEKSRVSSFSCC